ncbi:hypothetical protein Dalk_4791 [Desulfatibacillum aliphaticivorans]|uniref:Uncharacterized protein n=2 Tax=Desulfatibacillum aliphaticivorans TaxID=218208 RepID=B8FD37_DESAL|nr:hypothetical protein Dalk_4791 [Desulfatibacillum aliphaticivorans]
MYTTYETYLDSGAEFQESGHSSDLLSLDDLFDIIEDFGIPIEKIDHEDFNSERNIESIANFWERDVLEPIGLFFDELSTLSAPYHDNPIIDFEDLLDLLFGAIDFWSEFREPRYLTCYVSKFYGHSSSFGLLDVDHIYDDLYSITCQKYFDYNMLQESDLQHLLDLASMYWSEADFATFQSVYFDSLEPSTVLFLLENIPHGYTYNHFIVFKEFVIFWLGNIELFSMSIECSSCHTSEYDDSDFFISIPSINIIDKILDGYGYSPDTQELVSFTKDMFEDWSRNPHLRAHFFTFYEYFRYRAIYSEFDIDSIKLL